MKESTTPARLELRWVPVVDARGREQLVAHWVDASARHGAHAAAHHAA